MPKLMRNALLMLTVLSLSLIAFADDQKKAEKQINKVSAMAADLTGRRAVNQGVADQFHVKSSELVTERRENNLNYGSLFVVHELMAGGTKLSDIAAQLKSGKKLYDVANEFHADWKKIADDAKKLNNKIEDNLYDYFLGKRTDVTASYNPAMDGVAADQEVTKQDLADAQDRYLFWKDRATAKQDGTLEHNKEQAARQTIDPVRKGGPQSDQVGNTGPAVPR
jgi:hypothetical protein